MTDDATSALNDYNTSVIEEFRANRGKLGGRFEGANVLLLHTTGAKSGMERVNPLAYLEVEGHLYVFASKAGAHSHPDWYYNLVASPKVTVEVGEGTHVATAVEVKGEERHRVFTIQKELVPTFAEYEAGTDRVIPVVELQI
jgi:deazaflavin-dependent oxidoreductase (nitroreductase family)